MKKIGYTTGCFDLFHIGHLNILKRARLECDYLIVGVTSDELATSAKKKRLVIPFQERMDIVESIKFVDEVVPQTSYDKMEAWNNLKFDKMFVGDDWKGTDAWNKIEKDFENNDKTRFYKTSPIAFIERYCSRLSINQELTKVCQFVALRIENNNLIPENTPHSVAAGIIYFIAMNCNLNINKHDVNKVSEISEVTINKCFKKLQQLKDQLIPKVILDKYNK